MRCTSVGQHPVMPRSTSVAPCSCAANRRAVTIEVRPPTRADALAHCAGEDEESVRWLTGGYGTVEGYGGLPRLAGRHAAAGQGKRGIEVWPEGRLAGYLDCDPMRMPGRAPEA
jgi:hypothetical protein